MAKKTEKLFLSTKYARLHSKTVKNTPKMKFCTFYRHKDIKVLLLQSEVRGEKRKTPCRYCVSSGFSEFDYSTKKARFPLKSRCFSAKEILMTQRKEINSHLLRG